MMNSRIQKGCWQQQSRLTDCHATKVQYLEQLVSAVQQVCLPPLAPDSRLPVVLHPRKHQRMFSR